MRVLLDECLPRRLRRELEDHEVATVEEMGWKGFKNGALLCQAAPEFDVFLTVDRNLRYQQNLSNLPISVVVLVSSSNDIGVLRPMMPSVREVLGTLGPGELREIRVG